MPSDAKCRWRPRHRRFDRQSGTLKDLADRNQRLFMT